ncbi:Plasma membrane t-SNARE, secretory vesicle fusion [Mortierella sp. AD094]|nr:Plasma membrane t-SNARE, secretory vesicle fusion [Mortierella sp. AD094]
MSRDRLNDFNKSSEPLAHSYPNAKNDQTVELTPLRGNNNALTEFFQETEVIQTKIQQFQSSINEIDQLFTKNLNSRADQEGSKLLTEKTKASNGLSSEIYERLRALTAANMRVRTKEEYDQRKLRTTTLSRQFKEAVSRFQGLQYQNGQRSKETLARQYRIANPAATEEDIQRLVNEDQGGVFSQQLLQQARGQQAAAALNSVQDRQRELHRLQESIVELAQLYTQLEHLISDQDHTFQEIEGNVTRAEDSMEKGLTHVIAARDSAVSARKKKWMCVGIIALVIIIILIIGAIQGWFTPKK